jgi:hypothetical protein
MSYPLRPKQALSSPAEQPEPRFAGAAATMRAAQRPIAVKPAADDHAAANPPLRFPGEARHDEPPRLTAGERLSVSSAFTGGPDGKKRPGMLRGVAFATLLSLAAVGAFSLYHIFAGAFLP